MTGNRKFAVNRTTTFYRTWCFAIAALLIAVLFTGCGGGGSEGGDGGNTSSVNSEIGAPLSILDAQFTGTVGDIVDGKIALKQGQKFYLWFKSSTQILGDGANPVHTTSWNYKVTDGVANGVATLNYTWGRDEFTLKFAQPCSGTYELIETIFSPSSRSKVTGPFTIQGIGCSEMERLYSNPSTDQWDKTSDGSVGNIAIRNTASHGIDIALWNPDNGNILRYHINANTRSFLQVNGSILNIGNNWGIQVPGQGIENVSKNGVYITSGDYPYWEYQFPYIAPGPTEKAITGFTFTSPAATGVINEDAKTISVTVPYGTNVTALKASFTKSGASVKVGATTQVSAVTANNFTSPVVYTVTALDSSTVDYTVTVTIAPDPAKAITGFSFTSLAATGVINEAAKTISVTVPYGTDVTALIASFTTSGASVKVGATTQVSAITANNFTSPVVYTVTALDSSTVNYTATVTISAYADNGDGTVLHGVTGLVWQKQDDAVQRNWDSAISYCSGLSLAGSGWRLPEHWELQYLLDFNYNPTIDPIFINTIGSGYWSSSYYSDVTSNPVYVTFQFFTSYNATTGRTYPAPKTSSYYVRCVR